MAISLRTAVKAASQARDMRSRRPPSLTVSASGRNPVVRYLTPDDNTPHGGIRVNYRHVDLLNAAGIEATVLHSRRGFRCDWFANDTRVTSASDARLSTEDILVVPEFYAPGFHLLPPGLRKVIFNQGPYYTFARVPFDPTARSGAPYTDLANLVAMLTVSEDGAALLRETFPDTPVRLARPVVDREVFWPAGTVAGRRIAYLPRRRQLQRNHLLHMLHASGVFTGWELVPIDGRTEHETAELMRGSAIFLSFSEREGFGLPPAEAMASGCYVVGFTGMGGRDFFDPAYCTPVPEDNLVAYLHAVRDAIRRYDTDPEDLSKAGLSASERILGRYTEEGLLGDLLQLYRPLLHDTAPPPLSASQLPAQKPSSAMPTGTGALFDARRRRAGLPTQTSPGGTSRSTTAPVPTRAPAPTVTPSRISAPAPT